MNEISQEFEKVKIEEIPKHMEDLYNDLTELQHQLKQMDLEQVRFLLETELKDFVDTLKISYKNEIKPLPSSPFKTDVENLLYNAFGESFFD
jgi:hypothetical protein